MARIRVKDLWVEIEALKVRVSRLEEWLRVVEESTDELEKLREVLREKRKAESQAG